MYKLKKLVSFVTTVSVLLTNLLTAPITSANSSSSPSVDTLLPSTTDIFVKIDPGKLEKSGMDLYSQLTNSIISYGATAFLIDYYGEETENSAAVTKFLTDKLNTEPFTIASQPITSSYGETSDSLSFIPMTETEFNEKIKAPLETDNLIETTSYTAYPIYKRVWDGIVKPESEIFPEDGSLLEDNFIIEDESLSEPEPSTPSTDTAYLASCFTYFNGYLVKAGTEDSLRLIIENKNPLSELANYKAVKSIFLSGNAVTAYMNMGKYVEELTDAIEESSSYYSFGSFLDTIKAAKAIGFTITQTSTGLKLKTYLAQDPEKLKSLGYDYSNLTNPILHKYLPSKNPILLIDNTSTKDSIEMIESLPGFGAINSEIETSSGISLSKDIFPSLKKELAILINHTGDLFPSITILGDARDNSISLRTKIDALAEKIWDELSKNQDESNENNENEGSITIKNGKTTIVVSRNEIKIGGSTLYKFSFEIQPKESKNPYATDLPKGLLSFTLTLGVTDEKALLISTDKNIKTEYKGGFSGNKDLSSALSQDINSVTYLNSANLAKYLKDVIAAVGKNAQSQTEYENISGIIDNIFKVVNNLVATSKITNEYSESTISFDLDLSGIEEAISQIGKLSEFNTSNILNNKEFNDIDPSEWYGDDIYYMSSKEITNGNPDGSYQPNKTVNRAEFITLVVKTLESGGVLKVCEDVSCYTKSDGSTFKDVDLYSWYETSVYTAENLSLLKGIEGFDTDTDKFQPNKAVTRAEAATIISNALHIVGLFSETPQSNLDKIKGQYKDLKSAEKYLIDISVMDKFGIMQGVSNDKFAPFKTLNKAEAAKILRKFLDTNTVPVVAP
jgi:hypothetical protein